LHVSIRPWSLLIACKLDRLVRSTTDLLRIVDDLDRRGVGLIVISMGGQQIDTRFVLQAEAPQSAKSKLKK
jgi:DNA invertase Pin-like site-specific DNA recombinase